MSSPNKRFHNENPREFLLYLEYKYFLSTSYQLLGAAVTGCGSYWVIEHHLKETLYFQHKANCSANEKKNCFIITLNYIQQLVFTGNFE